MQIIATPMPVDTDGKVVTDPQVVLAALRADQERRQDFEHFLVQYSVNIRDEDFTDEGTLTDAALTREVTTLMETLVGEEHVKKIGTMTSVEYTHHEEVAVFSASGRLHIGTTDLSGTGLVWGYAAAVADSGLFETPFPRSA